MADEAEEAAWRAVESLLLGASVTLDGAGRVAALVASALRSLHDAGVELPGGSALVTDLGIHALRLRQLCVRLDHAVQSARGGG